MDPKIVFCYIWVLGRRESLEDALSTEIDDYGQVNYWVGVELGHKSYQLEVRDSNEFIKKYLIK